MKSLLKKLTRSSLCQWLMATLLLGYVLLVWYSSRRVYVGEKFVPGQKIIALWHGRLALATFFDRCHWPLYTFSSTHPDSMTVTKAARLHGVKAVYGSTREGALSGFRQAVRVITQGASLLITPDGPTGPRMHAQAGVVELARCTGLAVWPVSFSAAHYYQLRTWDKARIPTPFNTLYLVYGKSLQLARRTDAAAATLFKQTLEQRLTEVQHQADQAAQQPSVAPASAEEIAQRAARYAWKTRKRGAAS